MSFLRYPAYGDSGEEWLGEVPAHWRVSKLKWHAAVYSGRDEPSPLGRYPLYGANGIIGEVAAPSYSSNRVLVGRVGSAGMVNFAIGEYGVSDNALVVDTIGQIATRYCYYWFLNQDFSRHVSTTAQPLLTASQVKDFVVTMPPFEDQWGIATFLDHETAKIDALIAEQQKQIALLKEKRQAVISHAVTKGLDPNVPMKDSGVEWLGEVPAHWAVTPIKYVARVGNGSTPNRDEPEYWMAGDYPWLSSTVVNAGVVTEAEEFVTTKALAECHLPKVTPPAVLVGITGQGKTRGMAAVLTIEATLNQHLAYVAPTSERANVWFLCRYFDMAYERMRFESDGGGSTKGAITCEQVGNMRVPLPPSDEQRAIVEHIELFQRLFEVLVGSAKSSIALLGERRAALISAAVTGQIDVRDFAQAA